MAKKRNDAAPRPAELLQAALQELFRSGAERLPISDWNDSLESSDGDCDVSAFGVCLASCARALSLGQASGLGRGNNPRFREWIDALPADGPLRRALKFSKP